MTTAPRVSVCMPVFNTAKYLEGSLRSVSDQHFSDFELIVIDDGSSDGSGPLLEAYVAMEPRMRLIRRGNQGLIATRNELLALARGELVAWMDSDDYSMPNRLTLQVAAFETHPSLTCVGGFAQCVDPDGERLNTETFPLDHDAIVREQFRGGGMRFPTTMMRREHALAIGGFREPFIIGEDLDFLLRMGETGRLANLSDTVYVYRQHLSSVCATLGPQWASYRDTVLDLARERREFGSDRLQTNGHVQIAHPSAPLPTHFVARTYVHWARCALDNGDRRLAFKYAGRAVRAQPSHASGWKALIQATLGRA